MTRKYRAVWTHEKTKKLVELYKAKKTLYEMIDVLQVKDKAILNKLARLGYSCAGLIRT